MQENLEGFGFKQCPQQRHLHCRGSRKLVWSRLQSLANPVAHSRILDVHEFRSNGVGVDSLQPGDHLAQCHGPVVEEEFRRNTKTEICVAKSKLTQTQQWILRARLRKGIDPRNCMTKRAIRVNETIDPRL